jgi:FkbM family methyltransferase
VGTAPFGVSWVDDLRYYLGDARLSVALDVGAHRGETAQLLAECFPGAIVHSFEPVPHSFEALRAATAGLDVRCVNAAVGDVEGRARMRLGEDSGRSGFRARGSELEVRTVTLDRYAAAEGLERIDLLKIDAEGHEPWVLRGALGLLRAGRVDYVLAECEFSERADEPHGDFAAISALLGPLGYRVVSFYTGGVDDLGWRWGDVLFRRLQGAATGWVVSSPHSDTPPWPPPWDVSDDPPAPPSGPPTRRAA